MAILKKLVMRKFFPRCALFWPCRSTRKELLFQGTGYTELTWFLQAYVANEADFNNWNTCVGECSDYSFVETHACIDGLDHYCTKPTCTGRLYDCHSVGWRVHICQAASIPVTRFYMIYYSFIIHHDDNNECLSAPQHKSSIH